MRISFRSYTKIVDDERVGVAGQRDLVIGKSDAVLEQVLAHEERVAVGGRPPVDHYRLVRRLGDQLARLTGHSTLCCRKNEPTNKQTMKNTNTNRIYGTIS